MDELAMTIIYLTIIIIHAYNIDRSSISIRM